MQVMHVIQVMQDMQIIHVIQARSSVPDSGQATSPTMQKDLEQKDSGIKHLQKQYEKMEKEINENQLGNFKKDMEDKIAQVNSLDIRVEELEKENRAKKNWKIY